MPQTGQPPGRVLIVGASHGSKVIDAARAVPAGGLLICLEGDRTAAAQAAADFEREGLARHASVMIGDPALFVRKVSGPFDLILVAPDWRGRLDAQLRAKLGAGGRILDL